MNKKKKIFLKYILFKNNNNNKTMTNFKSLEVDFLWELWAAFSWLSSSWLSVLERLSLLFERFVLLIYWVSVRLIFSFFRELSFVICEFLLFLFDTFSFSSFSPLFLSSPLMINYF